MIVANKPPGIRALRNYSLCSGFLFYEFAHLEAMLARTLKTYVAESFNGTTDMSADDYWERVALSSAVIGSQRFSALRDLYKRLQSLKVPNAEQTAMTNAIFSQLGEIQYLRDRLAHQKSVQACRPYDGRWVNHDLFSTKAILEPKPILVHVADIYAAGIDCDSAVDILEVALMGRQIDHKPVTEQDTQLPAWRYKSSALIQGRQNIETALRQRALPPRPWRA